MVKKQNLNKSETVDVQILTNPFRLNLPDDQESFYTLAKDFSDKEMKPFAGL